MKRKIKKRLVKINGFLKSKSKPGLTVIHLLRLEIKHLEAFLELMNFQKNFGARSEIPGRLDTVFNEAGKLRAFGLEMKAIDLITHKNGLSKPKLFLKHLDFSRKKTCKKLIRKRWVSAAFKLREFSKHPDTKLSPNTCRQFLFNKASSMLDLLSGDILSDIKSLHQLRKILKSILYVEPICKKFAEPVVVFLKANKKLMKSVESEIGSLHDTDSFVAGLGKKNRRIHVSEETALRKIKREWQNDMKRMEKDLQTILPAIRQFALDLKDQSTDNLNNVRKMFN
jgi:hypothetical protein